MTWLKLDPERMSVDGRQRWIDLQHHVHDVTDHLIGTREWDSAAVYRSLGDGPTTYYFSPFAARLLLPSQKFPYELCARPPKGTVELMLGSSLANDTAWVELPEDERPYTEFDPELAEAQDSYWHDVWGMGEAKGDTEDEDLDDARH